MAPTACEAYGASNCREPVSPRVLVMRPAFPRAEAGGSPHRRKSRLSDSDGLAIRLRMANNSNAKSASSLIRIHWRLFADVGHSSGRGNFIGFRDFAR